MPSLHRDPDSGYYRIRFRYQGRNTNRSLRTKVKRRAEAVCARVDETLRLLEQDRIDMPAGVNAVEFILADGRVTKKAIAPKPLGLSKVFETYQGSLPLGHKEESTLTGERLHLKHLKRILGSRRTMQTITKSDLQDYISTRLKEQYHGRAISSSTVRKELVTFRMLWNWAVAEGLLVGGCPTKYVMLPLQDEKPPFMTRGEIESIIARGGVDKDETKKLWGSLYLSQAEVNEVLELIRTRTAHPFVYPMMVLFAHTGARRSEVIRSRIEDLDFHTRTVAIREKKKSRSRATTFRRVDMSPLLYDVLSGWMTNHPGGRNVFCQCRLSGASEAVTSWQAHHHFRQALSNTEWSVLRGFHVFRHSFASNLAAAGVDQRVIDEFMGHQTEEMRKRYRHLFPSQRREAIESVFGDRQEEPIASIPIRLFR